MPWSILVYATQAGYPGCALYARNTDTGELRHLCEVGDRCVFGGVVAEARGEHYRTSGFRFELDDDEELVRVSPHSKRPLRKPLDTSEPDYEQMAEDRRIARYGLDPRRSP